MKIQRSIEIKALAGKIWPLLVMPENIKKWCPVETIRYCGQQHVGLKTPFYFEELAIGRLIKMNFMVTEWVLNESVAFKMTSGDFVKGYELRYTIERTHSGNRLALMQKTALRQFIVILKLWILD